MVVAVRLAFFHRLNDGRRSLRRQVNGAAIDAPLRTRRTDGVTVVVSSLPCAMAVDVIRCTRRSYAKGGGGLMELKRR